MQGTLLGRGPCALRALTECRRTMLSEGAWVDHLPGWLSGHSAVFETIWTTTAWQQGERWMYERLLPVPRLTAQLPEHGEGHPVLRESSARLSAYYGRPLRRIGLACYRSGADSVALHGDRLTNPADAVVALLSLGSPRRFLLKPRAGGRSIAYDLGWGDLLVMGGTCQKTWLHGVPKRARVDGPRISIQFREAGTSRAEPHPPTVRALRSSTGRAR